MTFVAQPIDLLAVLRPRPCRASVPAVPRCLPCLGACRAAVPAAPRSLPLLMRRTHPVIGGRLRTPHPPRWATWRTHPVMSDRLRTPRAWIACSPARLGRPAQQEPRSAHAAASAEALWSAGCAALCAQLSAAASAEVAGFAADVGDRCGPAAEPPGVRQPLRPTAPRPCRARALPCLGVCRASVPAVPRSLPQLTWRTHPDGGDRRGTPRFSAVVCPPDAGWAAQSQSWPRSAGVGSTGR